MEKRIFYEFILQSQFCLIFCTFLKFPHQLIEASKKTKINLQKVAQKSFEMNFF